MSSKLKNGVRSAICIVLLIAIISYEYYSLMPDVLGWCRSFYSQKENSIDVLFVGSSNVYSNINPAILWNQAGIASFVLGSSDQPIWNTYYYVREAYKTQNPKLVVIDMLNLMLPYDYEDLSHAFQHIAGLHFSRNKIEAIQASATRENWWDLAVGWPIIHNRWMDGNSSGTIYDHFGSMEKGYSPVFFSTLNNTYEYDYVPHVYYGIDEYKMTEKCEQYLRMIIEYCQSKGSEVLLLKTPYIIDERADGIYNQAELIAAEYGISAVNMNKLDFGFVYTTDLGDTQHLDFYGVEKVDGWIVNYIKSNYTIPDRRGNKAYTSWDEYTDAFLKTKWMSPLVTESITIIDDADIMIDYVGDNSVVVYDYPINISKNTYYRVSVCLDSDDISKIYCDFYGGPIYDFGEQDMWFPLYGEDDWNGSTIVNSGDAPDSNVSFRIIFGEKKPMHVRIRSIKVEQLSVDD